VVEQLEQVLDRRMVVIEAVQMDSQLQYELNESLEVQHLEGRRLDVLGLVLLGLLEDVHVNKSHVSNDIIFGHLHISYLVVFKELQDLS
jgi:hypothetical protein